MADDFDIDKFLSDSFSKIEQKLDKKLGGSKGTEGKVTKKLDKVLNKFSEKGNNASGINTQVDKQSLTKSKFITNFNINNFNFDNVIDSRVLQELQNKSTSKVSINSEQLIKPLLPNDKVYLNEYKNADKNFILDRYVGDSKTKKTDNTEERINSNINRTNLHLKANQYKKPKESALIKQLKEDKSITYSSLIPMNTFWKEYITNLLNKTTQPDTIYSKMLKADLHGALIEVNQSKNKNQIGIQGLVILETRRTFNILTKEDQIKTILKKGNMFALDLPYEGTGKTFNLKIIGDNFMFKAVERSKAKFKNKYNL